MSPKEEKPDEQLDLDISEEEDQVEPQEEIQEESKEELREETKGRLMMILKCLRVSV